MACSEKLSKDNGWDYCTAAPDKLFGVYIGCCCKAHDIAYSKNGTVSREVADMMLRKCIRIKFLSKGKTLWLTNFVSKKYFWAVVKFGHFFWKTWSSKGVKRYK